MQNSDWQDIQDAMREHQMQPDQPAACLVEQLMETVAHEKRVGMLVTPFATKQSVDDSHQELVWLLCCS